jgi:hypothetical protein
MLVNYILKDRAMIRKGDTAYHPQDRLFTTLTVDIDIPVCYNPQG